MLVSPAGAVGAVGADVVVVPGLALVVEEAEPPSFLAVSWNSYVMFDIKPLTVALVAVVAGAVAVIHVFVPATRYCNVYPVKLLWAFQESVTELAVCAVLVNPAGAVGAVGAATFVVAFVVEAAEPLALVAVNWN